MLAVSETAAGEDDGQVLVVVQAVVHVRAKQDHRTVEQVGVSLLGLFQTAEERAEELHVGAFDEGQLFDLFRVLTVVRQVVVVL